MHAYTHAKGKYDKKSALGIEVPAAVPPLPMILSCLVCFSLDLVS